MAKRATLNLDTKNLEDLIEKLDGLGGDIKAVVEDALNQAADKITKDSFEGVQKPNLPAQGDYSQGDTEESLIKNPKVKWEGTMASVSVGFDYSKPGAAGYLISGRGSTPRMAPASTLNMVYTGKSYMKSIRQDMEKTINSAIRKKLEGG